jgi:hypothetical protein
MATTATDAFEKQSSCEWPIDLGRPALDKWAVLCERFWVVSVSFDTRSAQRRSWAGKPSKRTGDKCAALIEPPLGLALRRARETCETAALPLSYVGADQE